MKINVIKEKQLKSRISQVTLRENKVCVETVIEMANIFSHRDVKTVGLITDYTPLR